MSTNHLLPHAEVERLREVVHALGVGDVHQVDLMARLAILAPAAQAIADAVEEFLDAHNLACPALDADRRTANLAELGHSALRELDVVTAALAGAVAVLRSQSRHPCDLAPALDAPLGRARVALRELAMAMGGL